jgi:hypothetical protein
VEEEVFVGNIVVIDVKDKGSLQYVQDKYQNPTYVQDKYYKPTNVEEKGCKMEIVEIITFGFLMVNLDTIYLKGFLLYIPSSNGSTSFIVANFILRPFQRYMAFSLTP